MSPLMAQSGQLDCASVCPLSDNSGHCRVLAWDHYDANDPTATWPAISTSTAAGTAGRHPHLPFGLPGNPENRYHPSQFGVHPGNAGLCMEKYEKSRHQTTEECVIQSDSKIGQKYDNGAGIGGRIVGLILVRGHETRVWLRAHALDRVDPDYRSACTRVHWE